MDVFIFVCVCGALMPALSDPPQVDPSGSGRVPAADAALFLKRSGLADLVLGKVNK